MPIGWTRSTCVGFALNRALALFVTIRQLQPTTIIESGVNAGQSTYFMRQAAPEAKIIAIDPLDTPICKQATRWIDKTNSVYYTGKNFVDFARINWKEMIREGEIDPKRSLVFLDDHMNVFFKGFQLS